MLRVNESFTKKYPDFEITSTYRDLGTEFNPDGSRNYSKNNQWGLYNGWKYKKEGYLRASNPANGGGAHNVLPVLAIDFNSGNGKNTECHKDILKIAKDKIELEPILEDDPIHVQLKLFKQKYSKNSKNSSSSNDSGIYYKITAIADSIGFAHRDSQKKIVVKDISGPSVYLIAHLKGNVS